MMITSCPTIITTIDYPLLICSVCSEDAGTLLPAKKRKIRCAIFQQLVLQLFSSFLEQESCVLTIYVFLHVNRMPQYTYIR